jgi:hypothetical protein
MYNLKHRLQKMDNNSIKTNVSLCQDTQFTIKALSKRLQPTQQNITNVSILVGTK